MRVLWASPLSRQSDSKRLLHYLSLKPTLKFGVISSFSSSSSGLRIMQGTIDSSSRFGLAPMEGELVESRLMPAIEESVGEEAYGDRSSVFSIGQKTDFLLAGGGQ